MITREHQARVVSVRPWQGGWLVGGAFPEPLSEGELAALLAGQPGSRLRLSFPDKPV